MTFRPETIAATREHFADIGRQCIADAKAKIIHVNDLPSYIAWREKGIADSLSGAADHSVTFQQHAHYLETGECVALLP